MSVEIRPAQVGGVRQCSSPAPPPEQVVLIHRGDVTLVKRRALLELRAQDFVRRAQDVALVEEECEVTLAAEPLGSCCLPAILP